jgi:hypothetical protein
MENLPDDAILEIMTLLDLKDLESLLTVSSRFNTLMNTHRLKMYLYPYLYRDAAKPEYDVFGRYSIRRYHRAYETALADTIDNLDQALLDDNYSEAGDHINELISLGNPIEKIIVRAIEQLFRNDDINIERLDFLLDFVPLEDISGILTRVVYLSVSYGKNDILKHLADNYYLDCESISLYNHPIIDDYVQRYC